MDYGPQWSIFWPTLPRMSLLIVQYCYSKKQKIVFHFQWTKQLSCQFLSKLFLSKGVWLFCWIDSSPRITFSFPCRKWQGSKGRVFWILTSLTLLGRGSRRIIKKHKMVSYWVYTSSWITDRQHDDMKENIVLVCSLSYCLLFWS